VRLRLLECEAHGHRRGDSTHTRDSMIIAFASNHNAYLYTMRIQKIMSTVLPVRVPSHSARRIRELVDAGVYSSRSDLIREAIRRLIVSEGAITEKASIGKVIASLVSTIIKWNEKDVTDVVLFGSMARGQAKIESDIDLLVLVENEQPWMVRQRLYDLIYPVIPVFGVDISLIVMNKKRFACMVKDGDPFGLSVVSEGIQLHGDFINENSKSAHGKSP